MIPCRHRQDQPHVDESGYIWTVCVRCGQEHHVEPEPDWYTIREQYEVRHASYLEHIGRNDHR